MHMRLIQQQILIQQQKHGLKCFDTAGCANGQPIGSSAAVEPHQVNQIIHQAANDQLVQTWCSICSVYKQVYEYCSLFCSLAILGPRDDCITNYSFPFISVSSHSYCLLQCQTGAHFDIIQPRYPLFWCCSLGKVLCYTWRRFPNLITCPKYLSFCF